MDKLILGDCLEELKKLPDKSIDLVLTDPPYGTTQCKWDMVVPFEPMWAQLHRVAKDDAAIVMTASQPFTAHLIMSNVRRFRYCWVWDKGLAGNIFLAKHQPMKVTEDVAVFSSARHRYFPIKVPANKRRLKNNGMQGSAFGDFQKYDGGVSDTRNPVNLIYIPNTDRKNIVHPTQKPVSLMSYLIETYTQRGDAVLDPFLGSGTTAIAAKMLGRHYVGIEREPEYLEIARKRLEVVDGAVNERNGRDSESRSGSSEVRR